MKEREWLLATLLGSLILGPLSLPTVKTILPYHEIDQHLSFSLALLSCITSVLTVFIIARQARIADKQASISKNQLNILQMGELPRIYSVGPQFEVEGWKLQSNKMMFPKVEVRLGNYGRGIAICDRLTIILIVASDTLEVRDIHVDFPKCSYRDYKNNLRVKAYSTFFRLESVLSPGEKDWYCSYNLKLENFDEVNSVLNGTAKIWLDGAGIFSDMFGVHYQIDFRYRYDVELDMFVVDQTTKYPASAHEISEKKR